MVKLEGESEERLSFGRDIRGYRWFRGRANLKRIQQFTLH